MIDRRDKGKADSHIAQWDRYWAHGLLTSCADAFKDNYQGAVASRWKRFFASLGADARILDICTGNGAIAALAADYAIEHAADHTIDAIDLALIHPETALADRPDVRSRIAFHSRVGADDTPFEDGTFEAVVGQYALEYTPLQSTIREIGRIGGPRCRAMFVMHHPDSIVITTAAEEIRNGRRLFTAPTVFDRARAFIDYVGQVHLGEARRALSADARAERLRQSLNEAAAAVARDAADSPHPEILTNALRIIGEAYKDVDRAGRMAALERLDLGRAELQANLARLDDLMGAPVSAAAARRIGDLFREQGFDRIELEELHHDGARLMGWVLTAGRS